MPIRTPPAVPPLHRPCRAAVLPKPPSAHRHLVHQQRLGSARRGIVRRAVLVFCVREREGPGEARERHNLRRSTWFAGGIPLVDTIRMTCIDPHDNPR